MSGSFEKQMFGGAAVQSYVYAAASFHDDGRKEKTDES